MIKKKLLREGLNHASLFWMSLSKFWVFVQSKTQFLLFLWAGWCQWEPPVPHCLGRNGIETWGVQGSHHFLRVLTQRYHSSHLKPLGNCVENVMASVWSVSLCESSMHPAPWCAYAMCITMALTRDAVWLVEALSLILEFITQEKDRDGCPKIASLGSSKADLFFKCKKVCLQEEAIDGLPLPFLIKLLQLPRQMPMTASRKEVEHRASTELPISTLEPIHPFLFSHSEVVRMEKRFFAAHSGRWYQRKTDRLVSWCFLNSRSEAVLSTLKSSLHQNPLKHKYHFSLLFEDLTVTLSAVRLMFYSSSDSSCPWWNICSVVESSQNNKYRHFILQSCYFSFRKLKTLSAALVF